MSDTPPSDAKMAAPRWMRFALVGSLALNLLVAGLVVGAIARHERHPEGGDDDRRIARDVAAAPFVMALDPQDRRAVIGKLRDETGGLRQNREMLRERFGALLAALRAETFDRATVEALMAEQRAAASARQDLGQQILLDQIAGMSAAERSAYADRLEDSFRRGKRN